MFRFKCFSSLVLALLSFQSISFENHPSGFYQKEFSINKKNGSRFFYTLDGGFPTAKGKDCFKYATSYSKKEGESFSKLCSTSYKYDDNIYIYDRSNVEEDTYAKITTTEAALKNTYPKKELAYNDFINKGNKVLLYVEDLYHQTLSVFGFFNYLITGNLDDKEKKLKNIPEIKYKPDKLPKGTVLQIADSNKKLVDQKVYFFHSSLKTNLPIINITISPRKLYSYDEGLLVFGLDKPNWNSRKSLYAFLTVFSENKELIYEDKVRIKIHGNASTSYPLKSLRLYPYKNKKAYGFDFDFFGNGEKTGLQRINLRNSGQDSKKTYLADSTIHTVVSNLNFGIQRYKPYLIFINGQYYGILNARDRRDHYYLKNAYNLSSKNIDHIKTNEKVKRGTIDSWRETLSALFNAEVNTKEFYNVFSSKFDLNSFYDYFSVQIYIANIDWPQNNIAYWRTRYIDNNNKFSDGKWRWLLYDTDQYAQRQKGRDGSKFNSLRRMVSYNFEKGLDEKNLFAYAIKNKNLREEFIVRFLDLINSSFRYENFESKILEHTEVLKEEMPRHIRRWEIPASILVWEESVTNMLAFFKARKYYQLQHLQEVFELEDSYLLRINVNNPAAGAIQVNSISLGALAPNGSAAGFSLPWKGEYFKEMPLTLTAIPMAGHKFSHWSIEGTFDGATATEKIEIMPRSDIKATAVFTVIEPR